MSTPISKARLLAAMQNTYEDARFLIGRRAGNDGNFFVGLCRNKPESCDKTVLLDLAKECPLEAIPCMPEFPDKLVLSTDVYVWKPLINQNQRFDSERLPGYCHVADRGCPHHDIQFKIDHAKKTISFYLGGKERTVTLVEHSGYCWKPGRAQIFCMDASHLEQNLLDPFWSQIALQIGRRVLGIKPVI